MLVIFGSIFNHKSMFTFIYAYIALLLVGSFIGYYKAGSLASLLMGLISALLLSGTVFLYKKGKAWAGPGLLIIVLALDTFFSWRFMHKPTLFPSGLFTALSSALLMVIYLKLKKKTSL